MILELKSEMGYKRRSGGGGRRIGEEEEKGKGRKAEVELRWTRSSRGGPALLFWAGFPDRPVMCRVCFRGKKQY